MLEGPSDPMRAAQANMRPRTIKRFFKVASAGVASDGKYALLLDGKAVKSPGGRAVAVAGEELAEALAAEWAGQGETIEPAAMPLTRLVHSALDGVAGNEAEVRAEILRYAGSDLICYRAQEPQQLVERQAAAFDPILVWAEGALGARFRVASTLIHVAQTAAALAAAEKAIAGFADPVALAALLSATTLTGSALLALALAKRRLSASAAWEAAHVDEDFQIEQWGFDEEAKARRERRWLEMKAAATALAAERR